LSPERFKINSLRFGLAWRVSASGAQQEMLNHPQMWQKKVCAGRGEQFIRTFTFSTAHASAFQNPLVPCFPDRHFCVDGAF
jgi:hypothetical protein